MSRVNTPKLSADERTVLENGHRNGKTHAFRNRCQVILLKSEGRTSKEVGLIVKMSNMSVDAWVHRFKSEGIDGLQTRKGRGRKPL